MPKRIPSCLLATLIAAQFIATVCVKNAWSQDSADNAQAETTEQQAKSTDARWLPLKDLNGDFSFTPPTNKADWEARAGELRQRILVATGLWPMPARTPLNAVVHGKVQRDGFTMEKVYFESMPNHFVSGLLFRPDDGKAKTKRPAVLCPHGHGGRQQDHGPDKILQMIADGEENFEASGRFPKLARCAHLARMGCVTFIFDMLGYADSQQISRDLAHGFSKQRPNFESKGSWGLFSAQAEMRLQSVMGIQTWNSIRCLDFLENLPDVDASRIGVTGGSGGGTQTILLCAIDDRPIAAFPNGMVSTAMQGGCTCENCTLLRVGTGNVELAALFAPKPQAMTAANDWTKAMMTNGYPQLQQIYEMYGAKDRVFCRKLLHFPHNYNYVSRATMYKWFNQHLKLGFERPVLERDFELFTPEEVSVWNEEHPQPAGGDDYERALTKYMAEDSDAALAKLTPRDAESFQKFRDTVGKAVETIVGRKLPTSDDVRADKIDEQTHDGFLSFRHVVRHIAGKEEVPIRTVWPTKTKWNGDVVIWLDGNGQQALFQTDAETGDSSEGGDTNEVALSPRVQRLVDQGFSVVGVDLLGQGPAAMFDEPDRQNVVENPREAAAYSFCYNHTLFAQRVHDVMTLVAYVRGYKAEGEVPQRLLLVGTAGAGPIAAAARAMVGTQIDRALVETDGFRFANITSYRDFNFVPGIVKYGDLPALLALNAPHDLCVVDESTADLHLTRAAYQSGGGEFVDRTEQRGLEWLMQTAK